VLGLGPADNVDWLEIHWPAPSTRVDKFTDLSADRYVTIVEGQGVLPVEQDNHSKSIDH
jgi:hypothetical protein